MYNWKCTTQKKKTTLNIVCFALRGKGAVYLDSSQIVWVENRSLVKLHLGEVALEQGFQLKIRGNTKTKEESGCYCLAHTPCQRASLFSLDIYSKCVFLSRLKVRGDTVVYLLMEKNNFYIDIIPVLV